MRAIRPRQTAARSGIMIRHAVELFAALGGMGKCTRLPVSCILWCGRPRLLFIPQARRPHYNRTDSGVPLPMKPKSGRVAYCYLI
jgi:hypothetical protein